MLMSSSTFKLPVRSVWRPLVWWAKPPPSLRARSGRNTDPQSTPGHSRDTQTYGPHSQSAPGQDRPRRSASPGHLVAGSHDAHLTCHPDPQCAHHRQTLTPCLPGSWPKAPCSWLPCSATRVFSPGDLLRQIWSTWRGVPGALSTLLGMTPPSLKNSHNVDLWSLVRPTCAGLPWYKRMPPWLAVLAWRQRCPIAMCSVAPDCSSTASSHVGSSVCPPAAASGSSHGVAWVVGLCKGKGVRTGGRLHPGLAGERLLKQRPDRGSAFGMGASRMWALQAS